MYFEDIDLCRKLRDRRWKIHYEPNTTILHYGGVSAKKNILRILVEYRRSQIYFTRKYYGLGGTALLKMLLVSKSTANLLRYGIAYILSLLFAQTGHRQQQFANLLLNKKTLELAFGYEPIRLADHSPVSAVTGVLK
jgi:GT2 family glycosyltransferase